MKTTYIVMFLIVFGVFSGKAQYSPPSGGASGAGSVSVNGQTCTIGLSCTIPLSAVNAQSSTYQVLAADFSNYKTITVASGTFTITLVASASQPAAGQYIRIISYGSGVVTVARSGQNINGGTASVTLPPSSATAGTLMEVISDGTNYFASVPYVLPNPSASTLGGVQSKAAVVNNFLTGIGTDGSVTQGRPACGSLSDAGAGCTGTAAPAISVPYVTLGGVSYGPVFTVTPPGNISAWTWVNQGSATTDGTNNSLSIIAPANSSESMKLLVKSAPATPYAIYALIRDNALSGGSAGQRCGVAFRESSTGKLVVLQHFINTGTPNNAVDVDKFTNPTTFSAAYVASAVGPIGQTWYKLKDDGTNLTFSVCADNLASTHCTDYTTQGRTNFLASGPDQVGFFADPLNATYGMTCTLVDWTVGSS